MTLLVRLGDGGKVWTAALDEDAADGDLVGTGSAGGTLESGDIGFDGTRVDRDVVFLANTCMAMTNIRLVLRDSSSSTTFSMFLPYVA